MILKLIAALCLISMTLATALAANETVELGPAKISMDLQGLGSYKVVKDSPSTLTHSFGGYTFSYGIFPASIRFNNTTNQILLDVHQMSNPQPLNAPVPQLNAMTGMEHCIQLSGMLPPSKDTKKEPYTIDGQEGLLLTISRDQNVPVYIAAYSPDLKDGSGKTAVIVGSDFPWNTTKGIFESVKTQLGQGNVTSQGNITGQGNMSMGSMGMSNMGQGGMASQGGIIVQGNLIVQGDLVINMAGQGSMSEGGMMGMSSAGQSSMMGMGDMMTMMQSCMAMMQSMMGSNRWGQGNTAGQGNMTDMGNMSGKNAMLEQVKEPVAETIMNSTKDIHGH